MGCFRGKAVGKKLEKAVNGPEKGVENGPQKHAAPVPARFFPKPPILMAPFPLTTSLVRQNGMLSFPQNPDFTGKMGPFRPFIEDGGTKNGNFRGMFSSYKTGTYPISC